MAWSYAFARFGAYLRIEREGEVRAGDAFDVLDQPDRGVRLSDWALERL